MSKKNYWLNLFTGATWDEFRKAGSNITGFRESRWNLLQKIKPGDYLICYLTGVSRLIGVLEVTGKSFKDNSVMRDYFIDQIKRKLSVSKQTIKEAI